MFQQCRACIGGGGWLRKGQPTVAESPGPTETPLAEAQQQDVENNMNRTTDSADAAKRALLSRTSTFVSKPVPVPGGEAVDLSTLDPAALINSVAHETRFAIISAAEFNARWRAALRERFEAQGVVDELDAWLATGLSNGRPLRLSVMAIKPNDWFCVHAHPNIELMQTLVGTLFTPVKKLTSYNAKAPRTCDSHTGTR